MSPWPGAPGGLFLCTHNVYTDDGLGSPRTWAGLSACPTDGPDKSSLVAALPVEPGSWSVPTRQGLSRTHLMQRCRRGELLKSLVHHRRRNLENGPDPRCSPARPPSTRDPSLDGRLTEPRGGLRSPGPLPSLHECFPFILSRAGEPAFCRGPFGSLQHHSQATQDHQLTNQPARAALNLESCLWLPWQGQTR